MILGYHSSRPSKWRGLKTLFDPRVPDRVAVELFIESLQRKQRNHLVTLRDAIHTVTFAPSGAGKGQGIILPFLETCEDSAVVNDPKGELFLATSETRKRMGHEVRVNDPYHVVTNSPDTHNVIEFVDPKNLIADCREIASAIIKREPGDKEPHWSDSAEIMAAVMTIGVAAFAKPENRHLQRVREMLSSTENLAAGIEDLCKCPDPHIARLGNQAKQYQNKELNSVLTTLNRNLAFLDEPAIHASMLKSSYNPGKLRDGKMTIYNIIPFDRLDTQANYLRLITGSLLRACVKEGFQKQNKVHFVIDEAGSLGPMKQINDALDKYRANMVRVHLFYQSAGQLKSCFPHDEGQTMLSNTTQIFFGTNDYSTAQLIDNRLGGRTNITYSGSESTGGSSQGSQQGGHNHSTSWNRTQSWSAHERRLMRPEEILTANKRFAITFVAGLPPIATWLAYHYENNYRPRRLPKWVLVRDAVCWFLFAVFLAVLWTGVLYNY